MSRTYKDAPYEVRAWRGDPRYGKCPSKWRPRHWRQIKAGDDDYVYSWNDYPRWIEWLNAQPEDKTRHVGRKRYTYYGTAGWTGSPDAKRQFWSGYRAEERQAIAHEDYDRLNTKVPRDLWWHTW